MCLIKVCQFRCDKWEVIIGLNDGLAPKRWQAIQYSEAFMRNYGEKSWVNWSDDQQM